MASGWGLNGQTNLCSKYFSDFATCMNENKTSPKICLELRDDYLECLHHKKEQLRRKEIKAEEDRQIAGLTLDKKSSHDAH